MTTKRFDWDVCDGDVLFYENGAVIDYDDIVELLNELHEENIVLKQEVELLRSGLRAYEDNFVKK